MDERGDGKWEWKHLTGLALLEFSVQCLTGGTVGLLIPFIVNRTTKSLSLEAHEGTVLGAVIFGGLLAGMVSSTSTGAVSDRLRRRRPFVSVGTVLSAAPILLLAVLADSVESALGFLSNGLQLAVFSVLLAGVLCSMLGLVEMVRAAFNALLAEVPPEQLTTGSALLTTMSLTGTLVGLVVCGLGLSMLPFWAVVLILGAVAGVAAGVGALVIHDSPRKHDPHQDSLQPDSTTGVKTWKQHIWGFVRALGSFFSAFGDRNFVLIFVGKCLVTIAVSMVQNFVVMLLDDLFEPPYSILFVPLGKSSALPAAVLMVEAMAFAVVGSAATAAVRNDKLMYEVSVVCVAVGSVLSAAACLLQSLLLLAVGFAIFGLGPGMGMSAGLALSARVMPSSDSLGRDFALNQLSMTLPFGALLAGLLVDVTKPIGQGVGVPALAYMINFLICAFFALLSGAAVLLVRVPSSSQYPPKDLDVIFDEEDFSALPPLELQEKQAFMDSDL